MNERAKAGVYWPGITTDILKARQSCASCNRNMPSQSRLPPAEAHIPTAPFEAIACDYFHFKGWYYLVAADRLSGWVELSKVKVGTNESGAPGLCIALRRLMITFGVPVEIASDGGLSLFLVKQNHSSKGGEFVIACHRLPFPPPMAGQS